MYSAANSDVSKKYQQIGTRDTVDGSTPHRLIQMLMEHFLLKVAIAKGHIEHGDVEKKGVAIGDAISIVNGLQASLNHKANARMSENFDALYDYMMRRLLEANLNNDVKILGEVTGLMRELKEAWDAIADDPAVVNSTAVQN